METKKEKTKPESAPVNDDVPIIVDKLYNNSRLIISEFVEDGVISGFNDIPLIVWYNAISSLCALALRLPEIKDNEKLQEAVVYSTMLKILENDVPLDKGQRESALILYKKIAPTIIDVLIPGKDDSCCCGCFALSPKEKK